MVEENRPENSNGAVETDPAAATGTLGKALATLELVVEEALPMRFTDILARSGQPRGTLHRQLSHLVEEGLLELGRDMTYAPGLRLLRMASRAWSKSEFRLVAEPHLRTLHALTGETVHLGVLRGHDVIYLDKVESRASVRMYSQIGNASPAYCTGVGKAALSALPPETLAALLEGIDFRIFTPRTHRNAESLLAEVGHIREEGLAFDREEHESGIQCIAAPIWSEERRFVAGISVTAPAYRIGMAQLCLWADPVRQAAAAIRDEMHQRLGPRRTNFA